ncbi:MAG: histidine--tRNA ligase [Clostridia bacterium]|nr:histidine--tRNA ligase [Clostridia bacterium]
MAQKIQRPKGTADVTVSEVYKWHFTENLLRDKARIFGYRETRFPVFEHTELFVRGVGDTTDVVQKEMYTFEDKGGRSMTLRPEGTASTVRSYIENGEAQNGAPYKAYYIVPNFRYEQPQAGRLREHHQFGIECFGAASFEADAEVISLAASFIKALGIKTKLRINSIGCPACRPAYYKALRDYFKSYENDLCETCRGRLEKNPMRILDCKSPVCQGIAEKAPRALDFLCEDCGAPFEGLKRTLNDTGVPFEIDTGIVRGLDYYTKTVFEFVFDGIGAQGTVCGGGRYDGLIEQLGGAPTPAVGFGCGLERLIIAATASGFVFPPEDKDGVFIASADEAGRRAAARFAAELRDAGVPAQTDLCARSLKAQMKQADRCGAAYTLILGEQEAENNSATVKNMATGEQVSCALSAADIIKVIKKGQA